MTAQPELPALTGLRRRLTAVYLLAALAVIALIGGGAFGLLSSYFRASTDDALRRKMASEAAVYGARATGDARANAELAAAPRPSVPPPNERDGDDDRREAFARQRRADDVNPDLLAVYVLPLDATGNVAGRAGNQTPIADRAAFSAAMATGADWRVVTLEGGGRARLYTVRLEGGSVAALQLGRALSDQDQVLNLLLGSLLIAAAAIALIVGGASWWLAGRSIAPAHEAWVKQQAFVSSASHELRAPLALLRASAETARNELAREATGARELLEDVLGETDHMARLVEDLLTLSRLDIGKLPLRLEQVDATALVADTSRQMERLATVRHITLAADLPEAALLVSADPTRLRQVLLNILDNALRYTPRGGQVTLSAAARGDWAEIVVADTGIGIAPEDLGRVFDRFYRADSTRREGAAGSGLGLAIARAIIDAHHGAIAIDSALGAGTTLTVRLPLK